jgi:glucose-1-phosphate thymidylyltransferase
MKGILLAGGSGTRLAPMTSIVSKQLLPMYDKPMLYYPLSVLMLAGMREVMIISTPRDLPLMRDLLGDGSQLGIRIEYKVQEKPQGIAQALILAEEFVGGDSVCLILGDNLFYGHKMIEQLQAALAKPSGATVFAYHVQDPERYGVVDFDTAGNATALANSVANDKKRNMSVTPSIIHHLQHDSAPNLKLVSEITHPLFIIYYFR